MSITLTADEVRDQLKRIARETGSQKIWAARHKVHPTYLSDVINARRDPSDSILKALGLEKVVTYRVAQQ